jgi:hypothetical protein
MESDKSAVLVVLRKLIARVEPKVIGSPVSWKCHKRLAIFFAIASDFSIAAVLG